MNELMIFLNLAFMILCGKWAMECFEDEERQMVGWLYLFVSAWNAASLAAMIF